MLTGPKTWRKGTKWLKLLEIVSTPLCRPRSQSQIKQLDKQVYVELLSFHIILI